MCIAVWVNGILFIGGDYILLQHIESISFPSGSYTLHNVTYPSFSRGMDLTNLTTTISFVSIEITDVCMIFTDRIEANNHIKISKNLFSLRKIILASPELVAEALDILI